MPKGSGKQVTYQGYNQGVRCITLTAWFVNSNSNHLSNTRDHATPTTKMELTVTTTQVAPAITTLGTDTASTTGQLSGVEVVGGELCSECLYFSGPKGTQSSGGIPYVTHYNYNQGKADYLLNLKVFLKICPALAGICHYRNLI